MLAMNGITDIRHLLAARGSSPANRAATGFNGPGRSPLPSDPIRNVGRAMMVAVALRLRASEQMAIDGQSRDLIADIVEADATISDCIANIRNLSRTRR